MFLLILIFVSVIAFFVGLILGKAVTPVIKTDRKPPKADTEEDLKNFLYFDGSIQ